MAVKIPQLFARSSKAFYLARKHQFNSLKKHQLYLQSRPEANLSPKPRVYLAASIFSFLIFLFCLFKANQASIPPNINAQDPILAHSGLDLIRKNEHFEKFDPNNLQIPTPAPTPVTTPKPDPRLAVLQKYLSQFDSPLKEHSQDFLDAADSYGVEWRLVPAIAGVESTFGKAIPGGHDPSSTSYNGWGWGVYGDQVIKFKSWRQAIFAVTKGIKEGYIDKGLTDPISMNQKYASSRDWAGNLSYFLNDLNSFTKAHSAKNDLTSPQELQNLIFQQYAYLKVEDNHFSLQFSE